MHDQKYIILFDGVCNLCSRSVQFILKRDRKNRFLFGSLQGQAGLAYLKQFGRPAETFDSFLLVEGKRVFDRSTGALRMLKHLGNGWQLLYGLIIIPRFIRDGAYDWIARNRYKWFGKKETCLVPRPGQASKFLD